MNVCSLKHKPHNNALFHSCYQMYVMSEVIDYSTITGWTSVFVWQIGWWWMLFIIELICFFLPLLVNCLILEAGQIWNVSVWFSCPNTRCYSTNFLLACAETAWTYMVFLLLLCKLSFADRRFGCFVGSFHQCKISIVVLFFLTNWVWDLSFFS